MTVHGRSPIAKACSTGPQHARRPGPTANVIGGADPAGAALWPLSVDGLLVLATVGVLRAERLSRLGWVAVWLSFWLGIAASLAANIAAAPTLAWHPMLVAGWPPIALLLAVELLAHGPLSRTRPETATTPSTVVRHTETGAETSNESAGEAAQVITLADPSPRAGSAVAATVQEIMSVTGTVQLVGSATPLRAAFGTVPAVSPRKPGKWTRRRVLRTKTCHPCSCYPVRGRVAGRFSIPDSPRPR